MKNAIEYTNKAFFNKTCGLSLEESEDNWYIKTFDSLDVEDAFQCGQNNPNQIAINKIFKLNRQFLIECKNLNIQPIEYDRNQFIAKHWNDE